MNPHDDSHRPWPRPRGAHLMDMRWEELAFLHWRYPADEIQARLPAGLTVDRFDGEAWIAVVPFRMARVRPRGLPSIPGTDRFPELNVRTYVTDGVRPGVWFFSLDAASRLAVRGARMAFHLPYFDATMSCHPTGDHVAYESIRTHRGARPARFRARYGAAGESYESEIGNLDHWLTERYCLYAADKSGRLHRGEVHHRPWVLRRGWAEIEVDDLLEGDGLPRAEGDPIVHVAEPLEVAAWAPKKL